MSAHSADAPTDALRVAGEPIHERLPRWIRRLAVPILLAWVAVTVVLNLVVPQLDVVGQMRTVSMSPKDAPSMIAMKRVGQVFHEFKSDSSAMVVLEGDRPSVTRPTTTTTAWSPSSGRTPNTSRTSRTSGATR